jgi:hypothetical protein
VAADWQQSRGGSTKMELDKIMALAKAAEITVS